jgi:hypothetical protein
MKKFFIHFISFLYSKSSTFIENLFLKKKSTFSSLIQNGFYKDKLMFKNNFGEFIEKKLPQNNFFEKLIISENYIKNLIDNIFILNGIKKKLYDLTGFNYSVDFFLVYLTYNIDQYNVQKDIYANHWHRDKPFSQNTLKIIMPIGEILNEHGPMEIISSKDSSKINSFSNLRNINFSNQLKLVGTEDDIFFFLPNLCYHRAGNPSVGTKRTQIMLQLNPSNEWKYSADLYKKQYLIEPKFPFFNLNGKYKPI